MSLNHPYTYRLIRSAEGRSHVVEGENDAAVKRALGRIDRRFCHSSGRGLLGRPECETHGFLMLWTGSRWECPER